MKAMRVRNDIIMFNEKGQENMKKINPFLLTTPLAGKKGKYN